MQAEVEAQVQQAMTTARLRNALLDRATFYLFWQAGLRLGEAEDLCLDDLNLMQQQLVVRQGKGRKDRVVFLTKRTIAALTAYLAVRGSGQADHVFLYRHKPVSKDLLRNRVKATGKRTGVKVTPHRLRHTYATQLINAGCSITTLQTLMGHKRITTTLTYARVHDHTVAEDYFTAMDQVERRLALHLDKPKNPRSIANDPPGNGQANGHDRLLELIEALQAVDLTEIQQTLVTALARSVSGSDNFVDESTCQMELVFKEQTIQPQEILAIA